MPRVARARRSGSSPVGDRLGQRADQFTGRSRSPGAGKREGGAGAASRAGAATPQAKPDGFTVGGFVFKPGGRIKLDIIRDFDPIGSEDSFDPRTIPIDGSEGGNSNLHAKETRLFLDIRGPVEGKELQMYIETDFYGSSSVLRLRHAYGSYGGLLAGQTWSTFVDETNFPNTIDFESPMAFPSIRQAQVRWTQKLNANVSWAVAVEDNKSTITTPARVPGKAEYPMPDLATHVRFAGARGHAYASGFLGRARFRPTAGEPDDVTLWGMLLSGRLKTFGKDYAYGQFTFGDGVGRYRGGMTAVPDANGELQRRRAHRVHGRLRALLVRPSARRTWSSAWRRRRTRTSTRPTSTSNSTTRAINLLYWFLPNRAWAGVEYLLRPSRGRSAARAAAPIGFSSRFASTSRSRDSRGIIPSRAVRRAAAFLTSSKEHPMAKTTAPHPGSTTSSRRLPRASTSGAT